MKKLLFVLTAITLIASSCKTVYSTTSIEPNKSFVLGDNEHDAFEVTIKNVSKENLELLKMPNSGTKELIQILNPDKTATIKIEKNTALYIDNKSNNKVSVELNLKSSSHLSMGYKD
jgi:selenocysteine lyase/cysteine desulfurase